MCVLGPLVGRCKKAKVALPGGDAIGSRPLDMHQSGLRQLGARCNIEHGCVVAEVDHLQAKSSSSSDRWVTRTSPDAGVMLAKGVTVIHSAAREPDIVDICDMLNQMVPRSVGEDLDADHHRGGQAASDRAPGDR